MRVGPEQGSRTHGLRRHWRNRLCDGIPNSGKSSNGMMQALGEPGPLACDGMARASQGALPRRITVRRLFTSRGQDGD